jgi:4-amino-4-deoxy-L-arabinose transferase-like glycosyltransferase
MSKTYSFLSPTKIQLSMIPTILTLQKIATNTWFQSAIIGFVCFFSFFTYLGAHDVDLMEARNFVTVREMVWDNHWLIPTMNGEPRITKPPLPTWITAFASILAGKSEEPSVLRLPASIIASLMVFALWGFIRSVSKDPWLPIISALIFATSPLVIDMGRRGSWDIYCHSFMMLGIWTLSHGMNKKETSYGIFLFSGSLISLSFMSKGPVAFYTLFFPFFVSHMIVFGLGNMRKQYKGLILAFLVFLVLSILWPGFIYFNYPDMFTQVALQETAAWTNRHVKPFYFYAHFAAYSGVWVIFVLTGLIRPYVSKKTGPPENYRLILIWLILSLLLLSILPEKKERYLLPAMVPISMLAGTMWRCLIQTHAENRFTMWDRRWVMIHTALVLVVSLVMPLVIFKVGVSNRLISTNAGIGWSVAFLFLTTIILVLRKRKSVFNIFVVSLMLVCLINISVLPFFYQSPLYKKYPNNHPLKAIKHMEALNGLSLYSLGNLNLKLIWDVGRIVRPWYYKTESLPIKNQPIALISTIDPRPKIPSNYLNEIDVTLIATYPYASKKAHATYFITLITLKKKS